MGDIGRMVPLLPVSHECQRCLGVKGPLGEDREQEHLHWRESQPRGFFFSLRHTRTRKKWAKIQSVIG